ncbi:protein of unknown function [Stenotrophomonas maltophilia]|nr:protein of unknown function [Stenotrophomonas maltophilia]
MDHLRDPWVLELRPPFNSSFAI